MKWFIKAMAKIIGNAAATGFFLVCAIVCLHDALEPLGYF